ncbi:MAG: hypothetical protein ABI136_02530, partial [Ginsengibacter sp.]
MNRLKQFFQFGFLFCCVIIFSAIKSDAQTNEAAINARVNAMVKKMTLEEKVGQMAQVSVESLGKLDGANFVFDE